eukprot:9545846-Ditylum_brightwellii.AAC.1
MEDYHPIMGLWGDTIQYQFSSRSGMSALTLHANNIPDNCSFKSLARSAVDIIQLHKDDFDDEPFIQGIRHCLKMLKKHNIQSWLKDNPSWSALQGTPAQTLFIPSGAVSVPDSQAILAATNSMSPDGRVAQHRIWGSTLVTASDGTKQVKLGAQKTIKHKCLLRAFLTFWRRYQAHFPSPHWIPILKSPFGDVPQEDDAVGRQGLPGQGSEHPQPPPTWPVT